MGGREGEREESGREFGGEGGEGWTGESNQLKLADAIVSSVGEMCSPGSEDIGLR